MYNNHILLVKKWSCLNNSFKYNRSNKSLNNAFYLTNNPNQ